MASPVRDDRCVFTRVHQLFGAHQPLAELPTGVQVGEILLSEALRHEQCHRQRVAERERGRRAGSGHEVQRARFFRHMAIERDVGRLSEGRVRLAGDHNQPRTEPLDRLEQSKQFIGLAAMRQRDDDVLRLENAEVAVDGLRRMKKERRRAGAGERGRDLPADDARLAHAGDDDAAAAVEQQPHRALEAVVEAIDQRENGGRLGLQDLARQREVGCHGSCSRADSR